MRIALTGFVVLMGLMISAAAIAAQNEAGEEAGTETAEEMPPVQASPPDMPIAAPAAPQPDEDAAGAAEAEGESEK